MSTTIETQLKHLPRFRADPLFKDKLKQRLLKQQRNLRLTSFVLRFATVVSILTLIIGGVYLFNQQTNLTGGRKALQLFEATPVSAAEIIAQNIRKYLSGEVIYHEKTRYYLFDQNPQPQPIVYESWTDLASSRFRNQVSYPNGQQVDQGFNTDFRWDINFTEKKIYKDIYVYHAKEEKEASPSGTRVDLAQKFDELLKNGSLEAKETELNGISVYLITDIRTDPDKYWDRLYFARDTFQLLQTEKDTAGTLVSRLIYDIQESLPRNQENLVQYFTFQPPSDFQVLERHFDTATPSATPQL